MLTLQALNVFIATPTFNDSGHFQGFHVLGTVADFENSYVMQRARPSGHGCI